MSSQTAASSRSSSRSSKATFGSSTPPTGDSSPVGPTTSPPDTFSQSATQPSKKRKAGEVPQSSSSAKRVKAGADSNESSVYHHHTFGPSNIQATDKNYLERPLHLDPESSLSRKRVKQDDSMEPIAPRKRVKQGDSTHKVPPPPFQTVPTPSRAIGAEFTVKQLQAQPSSVIAEATDLKDLADRYKAKEREYQDHEARIEELEKQLKSADTDLAAKEVSFQKQSKKLSARNKEVSNCKDAMKKKDQQLRHLNEQLAKEEEKCRRRDREVKELRETSSRNAQKFQHAYNSLRESKNKEIEDLQEKKDLIVAEKSLKIAHGEIALLREQQEDKHARYGIEKVTQLELEQTRLEKKVAEADKEFGARLQRASASSERQYIALDKKLQAKIKKVEDARTKDTLDFCARMEHRDVYILELQDQLKARNEVPAPSSQLIYVEKSSSWECWVWNCPKKASDTYEKLKEKLLGTTKDSSTTGGTGAGAEKTSQQ